MTNKEEMPEIIYINVKIKGKFAEELGQNKLFIANKSKFTKDALREKLQKGD